MPIQTLTERTRSRLSPDDEHVLVLGGGHLGRELARRLSERNRVTLIDDDEGIVQRADDDDVSAHCADPTDVQALERAGAASVGLAVVATVTDRRNVLATQLLRSRFDVEDVVVLVNDPDVREAVQTPGLEVICVPDTLVPDLEEAVDRRIAERG